jgi:hypothetical protein
MGKRAYIGPSEAQINAERLAQRNSPYAEPHQESIRRAWDAPKRDPATMRLGSLVETVRAAFAEEVPLRLHEGPDAIGEGGTPNMHPAFIRYVDAPTAGDGGYTLDPDTGQKLRPLAEFYLTPARAALHHLDRDNPKRAAVVRHIALGSMAPVAAVMLEDVPYWCARIVAEETLRSFLRSITDMKVNLAKATATA